jgi:hypothetical protein
LRRHIASSRRRGPVSPEQFRGLRRSCGAARSTDMLFLARADPPGPACCHIEAPDFQPARPNAGSFIWPSSEWSALCHIKPLIFQALSQTTGRQGNGRVSARVKISPERARLRGAAAVRAASSTRRHAWRETQAPLCRCAGGRFARSAAAVKPRRPLPIASIGNL